MRQYLDIKFTCNGREMLLGHDNPYQILTVSGLEAADYNIHMQPHALLDGSQYQRTRVEPRFIELVIDVLTEERRNYAVDFLHPHHPVDITVNRNGRKRRIRGYFDSVMPSEPNMYGPKEFTIGITCPDPYFYDISSDGRNIAEINPLLAFPLGIDNARGKVTGYFKFGGGVVLDNRGQVDTGVAIEFRAARNAVTAPKITNLTTGEFMRSTAVMSHGSTLKISSVSGEKGMWLDGVNILNTMDRASTFFSLAPGKNTLDYTADINGNALDAYIYFTPRYIGV